MMASSAGDRDRVLEQFSVEGGSTIDRATLASVLLELSGAAWTARHVNSLLEAFRQDHPSKISCQEFVDWVFEDRQDTSPSAAPVAAAPAQAASDAYTEGLIGSIRSIGTNVDVEGLVQQASADTPEDREALKKGLLEVSVAYVNEAHRRGLSALWDEFCSGADGALTLEQCTQFVATYLRRNADASEELVKALVQLSAKLQAAVAESGLAGVDRAGVEALAQDHAAALHAKLAPSIKEIMEELCQRDPQAIAAELLEALGQQEGGLACKDQFEQGLDEAFRNALKARAAKA